MPNILFDERHIYDPKLPAKYAPVIDALQSFLGALRAVCKDDSDAARERVHSKYQAVRSACQGVLTPDHDVITEDAANRAFASGMLRLLHYRATVLDGARVVDTADAKTFPEFALDLQEGAERQILDALKEGLDLKDQDIADLQEAIAPELRQLDRQRAIIAALEELHPLHGTPDTVTANTHALWSRLYVQSPLRPGEVQVVRSSTAVFFVVPFKDNALRQPLFDCRDEAEQEILRIFFKRIEKFEDRYYAHFPMFGFFDGNRADPELLQQVAKKTNLTPEEVAQSLTPMVTILPKSEVDQYIIHDTWGHTWQSLLFKFEEVYREVARFAELPPFDRETPEGRRLMELVDNAQEGRESVRTEWPRFLSEVAARRISLALSGLVAELLADAVEYKYLALFPEKADLLLSSSKFKDDPAKIDLSITDIPIYFRFALRGLRRLLEEEVASERLTQFYLSEEPVHDWEAVKIAADRLLACAREWHGDVYEEVLTYVEDGAQIQVNLFTRLTLNVLCLVLEFNRLYRELERRPIREDLPLKGFRDILVFSMASFYEADMVKHLWHLDEFAHNHFVRCYDAFLEALEEAQ